MPLSLDEVEATLGSGPDAEAVVRGWVHDETGHPIEGAELTAEREEVTVELDADDGSFVARGPAGSFALIARAEGRLPQRLEGLALQAGEEVRQVVIALQPGLTVEGRVLSSEGASAGTHVTIEAPGYLRSLYSDDDGRFTVGGLPVGSVTVRAYDDAQGTDVVETHSGDRDVVLRPHRDGKIAGIVRDAKGAPVEGAMIFVDEVDPLGTVSEHDPFGDYAHCELIAFGSFGVCGPMPECLSRATTEADGRFEVEVAPGSRVTLAAQLGDASASALGSAGMPPLELRLAKRPSVRVRTLDSSGQPVSAKLRLHTERSNLRMVDTQLTTRADGRGELEVWPGIPVTLELWGAGIDFPEGKPPEVTISTEKHVDDGPDITITDDVLEEPPLTVGEIFPAEG
jgi:hypothetical protein